MHAMQDEELVLCRIQKTRTGSEVEEEINSNENHLSPIAHHQATLLPQVPVSSVPVQVPFDASEKPGSKRLRRDNSYNGTQYCNTSSALMAPAAATTPDYQHQQYCYNTTSGVPDHDYHQQQYGNTTSSFNEVCN